MTPSWYDVLGVEPTATPEEVRAAWKRVIADLEPGERRFRTANQAAEVLLDPVRRAEHDAELAAQEPEPEPEPDPAPAPVDLAKDTDRRPADDPAPVVVEHDTGSTPEPAARPWQRPRTVLALGVLALVLTVATVVAYVAGGTDAADRTRPAERDVAAARAAAEAAAVPVLSYDYRELEETKQQALVHLTDEYAEEYERYFSVIEENAPRRETVVDVRVVASGVTRTGPGRVDVLLFLNRPTTNADTTQEYRDQVTMQMLDVDGRWLLDCMITQPGASCGE